MAAPSMYGWCFIAMRRGSGLGHCCAAGRDSHRTGRRRSGHSTVSVTDAQDSLERGFDFILDKIGDKAEMVRQYNNDNHVIWWCGHYQSSFDGGPTMSAELLKKLADFGVPIYIDNYTNTDHDQS